MWWTRVNVTTVHCMEPGSWGYFKINDTELDFSDL